MRLIKPLTIKGYYTKHRDAKPWLKNWMVVAKAARWQDLDDIRRTYPRVTTAIADSKRILTIFKLKGNNYRFMVAIHYNTQRIYIRDFMTHEEYNNQSWKKRH
jgi:mRNA interferase HigB